MGKTDDGRVIPRVMLYREGAGGTRPDAAHYEHAYAALIAVHAGEVGFAWEHARLTPARDGRACEDLSRAEFLAWASPP